MWVVRSMCRNQSFTSLKEPAEAYVLRQSMLSSRMARKTPPAINLSSHHFGFVKQSTPYQLSLVHPVGYSGRISIPVSKAFHTTPERPSAPAGTAKVIWKAVTIASLSFGAIVSYVLFEKQRTNNGSVAKVESTTIGKPKLGGPWTLVNQNGEIVSSSDLHGKYQLLYFGFSFCPDICPQEMEKQSSIIESLDKKFGPIVQPIFVTVDPDRDTVAQIHAYCKEFHPRLIGLTGTKEQIKQVTRKFRVYYNEGIRTSDEDYLVDHSIIQYFINTKGEFAEFFGKNLTVNEIVDTISALIQTDQNVKPETKGQAVDTGG